MAVSIRVALVTAVLAMGVLVTPSASAVEPAADPSPPAPLLLDLNKGTGAGIGQWDPWAAEVLGTTVFFAGQDASGVELWKSDGTDAGTELVKNIRVGGSLPHRS